MAARASSRRPRPDRAQAQLDDITDKLRGVHAIGNRLDNPEPGQDQGYLLLFDNKGRGHAIVATGNPDTAVNIVTYVPGTGARLGHVGGDIGRADSMAATATRFNLAHPAVGIMWLGYDAPTEIVPGAADDGYARAAEADLHRLQDGLRVTHDGPPSHNTVIGHSYGSTVVGYTARDVGVNTDDVVFVGSPGVGVDHAGDLHLSPSRVWASTAAHDPIHYAGPAGASSAAALVPLVGNWLAMAAEDQLIFGTNPSSADFGGHVFHSDPGAPLHTGHAHSQYWDWRSTSLTNIGHIVAGQPGQVTG